VATTRQPYAYVADNPLNGVDPIGLFNCDWWNPFPCISLPSSPADAWNRLTTNATNPGALADAGIAGITAGAGALCVVSGVCEVAAGAVGAAGAGEAGLVTARTAAGIMLGFCAALVAKELVDPGHSRSELPGYGGVKKDPFPFAPRPSPKPSPSPTGMYLTGPSW
jgi:hypothetical protein